MTTILRRIEQGHVPRQATAPRPFALEAVGLVKVVESGGAEKIILDNVDIAVETGSFTVVKGESGSGKTSLLHCLAGLDQPTKGTIMSGDVSVTNLTRGQQIEWRGQSVGYVGQKADLLPGTVLGSILDPHMAAGHDIDPIWAREVLGTLGIDQPEFLKGSTANLSGGEQQRVAIARGLVHKPDILFADEPTSALDSERTVEVHGLLASMVEDHGVTVVMVSHDPLSELYASHIEVMRDGQMVA